jgi:hypothetical protein
VLQDEFAVARLMTVVLKARLACDQGLENRLALDQPESRDVLPIEVASARLVMNRAVVTAVSLMHCAFPLTPARRKALGVNLHSGLYALTYVLAAALIFFDRDVVLRRLRRRGPLRGYLRLLRMRHATLTAFASVA